MKWRLILSEARPGDRNMAIDEALLYTTANRLSLPTLRLYDWKPACLSLGYSQPYIEVDEEAILRKGWTIVRRPTGGRAILHTQEITYSFTAPQNFFLVAGPLLVSYQRISSVLLRVLELLGTPARADQEYQPLTAEQRKEPICFETPSNYEVTVNGKKIVGSAQARKYGGVLQHGSLPLSGDIARIAEALAFRTEDEREKAKQRIRAHATTYADISGREISWQEAAKGFIEAFTEIMQEEPNQEGLSEIENEKTREFLELQYANSTWIKKI
jgi:lipoate-protein ligase A